jgi:hypothetical protein
VRLSDGRTLLTARKTNTFGRLRVEVRAMPEHAATIEAVDARGDPDLVVARLEGRDKSGLVFDLWGAGESHETRAAAADGGDGDDGRLRRRPDSYRSPAYAGESGRSHADIMRSLGAAERARAMRLGAVEGLPRQQLAAVTFKLGAKPARGSPRAARRGMRVLIPRVRRDAGRQFGNVAGKGKDPKHGEKDKPNFEFRAEMWRPASDRETLERKYRNGRVDRLSIFQRDPEDERTGAKRGFRPSKKAFSLLLRDGSDRESLVFGKVGPNLFRLVLMRPFSYVQAFGLAVAACQAKA